MSNANSKKLYVEVMGQKFEFVVADLDWSAVQDCVRINLRKAFDSGKAQELVLREVHVAEAINDVFATVDASFTSVERAAKLRAEDENFDAHVDALLAKAAEKVVTVAKWHFDPPIVPMFIIVPMTNLFNPWFSDLFDLKN